MIIESQAYARAGLLGNPTDGYFGKTISFIIKNFAASISLYETPELCIEPQEEDLNVFKNIHALCDSVRNNGYYGGARLIKATIKKFYDYVKARSLEIPYRNFTIRYHSSIPRQVGLAGSSAIVTATMRALCRFYDINVAPEELASLILSVEKDELGITAGLQDRVIQVYEGCVYMDFEKEKMLQRGYGAYTPVDIRYLPNLYIGYKTQLSKVSGTVLNDLRARFEKGDPHTVKTLARIASLAQAGKEAIEKKDYDTLHKLINENFDLRCTIMNVSDSNKEMVAVARSCGASAKFCGSGGSIVGTYENERVLAKLFVELKKINVRIIKPAIG